MTEEDARIVAEQVVAKWFLHEWINQRPRPDEEGRDKLIELIVEALTEEDLA